jgi:hypothetical protein
MKEYAIKYTVWDDSNWHAGRIYADNWKDAQARCDALGVILQGEMG